jgi:c-di-GMP-binding flagellar brake protein YcgR
VRPALLPGHRDRFNVKGKLESMETPLSDQLHGICRALLATLTGAVPGEVLACDLVQIDRREFHFQSVAAAHFPGGPVRRLLLGCEERLAQYFADQLRCDPDQATGDPVHDGLQAFCTNLQINLVASGLPWAADQAFLVHDHEQFRVQCSGVRNFLFRIAVAEGRLDLILDLAPLLLECQWLTNELTRQGTTQVNARADAITDPNLVRRIMAHLAASGADVQVKLDGEGERLELLQATFLARQYDPSSDYLPLTCARRTSLERAEDIPEKVTLVFILQDKLLQCSCPVLDHDHAWLDDDISLPILRLGLPAGVTFGQRRGAFRLEPPEKIKGTVRRFTGDDPVLGAASSPIPIQLLDISFTGAMLRLGSQAMVSAFKGGAEVECMIDLPPGFGRVAVRAIVRRLHLSHDDMSKGPTLGVEFLGDPEESGQVTIRNYIQNRHATDLSSGSAQLKIG